MKKKSIFIIIGSVILVGGIIAGILLINPKSETPQTETDNTISESTEDLGTTTNADRGASTGEVVESNIQTSVNAYESLSQDNIIKLDDGTYDFTDEFIGTAMGYDFFKDSTEQEVKEYLNEVIDTLIGLDPEGISEALESLSTATGSTLKHHTNLEQGNTENSENQESQSGNESTGNSGNTSNPGNGESSSNESVQSNPSQPSGGGLITDPNYIPKLPQSAIDAGITVGGFGGEYMGNEGDIF